MAIRPAELAESIKYLVYKHEDLKSYLLHAHKKPVPVVPEEYFQSWVLASIYIYMHTCKEIYNTENVFLFLSPPTYIKNQPIFAVFAWETASSRASLRHRSKWRIIINAKRNSRGVLRLALREESCSVAEGQPPDWSYVFPLIFWFLFNVQCY